MKRGAGLFQSRFMERQLVPRIVKLRLVSKYINEHVQRTAEIVSRIYVSSMFEMPSLKWELLWLKISRRSSSKLFFLFLFLQFIQIFSIETWCSAPLLSATSRYARVDQYHLSWRNLGWENVKYVERTGARREENPVRSKGNGAIFCPAGSQNSSNIRIQPFRPKSPGTVGQTFGDAGSVLSTFGRTGEYRRTATGLPLTTGKLSGVWERTPAVSA